MALYKIVVVVEKEGYGTIERSRTIRSGMGQGEAEMDFFELVDILEEEVALWDEPAGIE